MTSSSATKHFNQEATGPLKRPREENMNLRKLLTKLSVATVISGALLGTAAAYPDKPVTIVVPYSPGGATDSTARIMAQALQEVTGVSFIVENVPGAGTTIGAGKVARSEADGYTLLFGGLSANVLAPQIYSDVSNIDALKAFDPIAGVATQPLILVVNSKSKYQTLGQLLEAARKDPEALNFGSPGHGSAPHLISELFLVEAGIEATHIPFKGAAPAIAALVGGNIDFLLDTPTAPMAQVKAGKLRALGITTTQKLEALKDVPTMDSQGVDGFEANTWFAFFAPEGTDPAVLDQLNAWVNKALENDKVKAQMKSAYLYPTPGSRDDLQQFTIAERARWTKIIEAKGLKKN